MTVLTRYPIAAIRQRMREIEGPVLDFVIGGHRDETPPELRALLETEASRLFVSGTATGELDAFREAAVTMLARIYDLQVEPEAVLPVPGGRPAMSLLVTAATRPQDLLLVTEPGYPAMERIARQLRPRTLTVRLDPDRGFAPDLSGLSAESLQELSFVALNYPNNPTGAVVSQAAFDEIATRLPEGALLFNDAAYGPLSFGGSAWSLLTVAGDRHNHLRLLELHSLSKLFGVGPVPVSFLVGDPRTVAELHELSEYSWSDRSSLALQIGIRCLQDGGRLDSAREFYQRRLSELVPAVEALGFETFPPAGGMYLLCRAPREVGGRPVGSASEAAERLLVEHHLAVVPFETPPHGYLRFSGRYRTEDLDALVALGHDGPLVSA